MVNVAKREDGLLDYVNSMRARIDLARLEIETWEVSGGLTVREIDILTTIKIALKGESE